MQDGQSRHNRIVQSTRDWPGKASSGMKTGQSKKERQACKLGKARQTWRCRSSNKEHTRPDKARQGR